MRYLLEELVKAGVFTQEVADRILERHEYELWEERMGDDL